MKNLNGYFTGTHGGYGTTEIIVNSENIEWLQKQKFNTYKEIKELPENVILLMRVRHSGCINPQDDHKIFYKKLTDWQVAVYEYKWERTHHGTITHIYEWTTQYNENAMTKYGLKTAIDWLINNYDDLAERCNQAEARELLRYEVEDTNYQS